MASVFVIFSQNFAMGICCTELLPSNNGAGDTHTYTHRQQGDLMSLLLFFQNNGNRLKVLICWCVCTCINYSKPSDSVIIVSVWLFLGCT
jgi:hypothetical protein